MKKIISFCLMFSLIIVLSACGKSSNNANGRTVITFWDTVPIGDPGYVKDNALIKAFNDSQDKYFVKHVGYSFWDYWDKLNIVIAGNRAPDVGLNTIDNSVTRAEGNVIYDLQPLIDRDKFDTSVFYQNEIDAGSYKGDIYSLPFTATTRVLYYNLDLFKKAGLTEADVPTTWTQLATVAHQLDKTDSKGNITQLGFDPTAGQATYQNWLWMKGLDFFDKDLNPVLNDSAHASVLQWMKDFNSQFSHSQLQGFSQANQMLGLDPFTAGRMAMYIDTDSLYHTLQQHKVSFKYGVAKLPIPDGGKQVSWGSSFSLEMFNNHDAAKKEGAWQFYKYMMSKDVQTQYFQITGWLMSNKQAMEGPTSKDPILDNIVSELPYTVEKVYVPYAPDWSAGDWQQFYTEALQPGNTVTQALQDAQNYYLQKQQNYNATH